ncbi:MAG: fasciclin domain-containing protein [Actinomycetes bacterium]
MSKFSKVVLAVVAAASVLVAGVGVAGAQTPPTTAAAGTQNVVQIAAANPDFSTLVTAVQAAGLAETLSGKGPFTVFAPTNEAFAKIPTAQLNALLADKAKLTKVLTYHVVPGAVKAADLKKKQKVATVEGSKVVIVKTKKGAKIDGAKIIKTDIVGSNGVIHVIDSVIIPADAK